MSIDDDIFDVQNSLKGTDTEEAFGRILKIFNELEATSEILADQNKMLKGAINILIPKMDGKLSYKIQS